MDGEVHVLEFNPGSPVNQPSMNTSRLTISAGPSAIVIMRMKSSADMEQIAEAILKVIKEHSKAS